MSEDLYGLKDQKMLDLDIEDVVRSVMEDGDYSDFPIEVLVYNPIPIAKNAEVYSRHILESLLQDLDEEYGDPDGSYTDPSEGMKSAALVLAQVMMKDYRVWAYEPTGESFKYNREEAMKIAGIEE